MNTTKICFQPNLTYLGFFSRLIPLEDVFIRLYSPPFYLSLSPLICLDAEINASSTEISFFSA